MKIASGWTDYQLNERFANQDPSRGKGESQKKVFERIRRRGVVPQDEAWFSFPLDPAAGSLVDRVERYGPCAGTEAVFRSDFWLLMKQPDMPLPKLKGLIDSLSWAVGMSRPSHEQIWNDDKKDLIGLTQAYRNGIEQIGEMNSLNSAGLLGALYKEALWFGETEMATLLKTGFIEAITTFSERLGSHAADPNIAHFADQLQSDRTELCDFAIRRIIFTASEQAKLGDHAEVTYPFSRYR